MKTSPQGDAYRRAPEYRAWESMKRRCQIQTMHAYADYGGRGIRVCARWASYPNFLADMGRRPSAKHSLDRIDNDGDYTPRNCRWASPIQQLRNRRDRVLIRFRGRRQLLVDWCRELGLHPGTVFARLRAGWSVPRAFTTPVDLIKKAAGDAGRRSRWTDADIAREVAIRAEN